MIHSKRVLFLIGFLAIEMSCQAQVVKSWEHIVNHSNLKTEPFGLETDAIGNSWSLIQNEEGFNVQHYDSSGNTLWIAGLPVQAYCSDVRSMQLDQYNNAFVLVSLADSDTLIPAWHSCVFKYNSGGNELWRFFQSSPGKAGSMTVDDSGNVVIIGTSLDSLAPRLFITKLNVSGALLWSKEYPLVATTANTELYGIKLMDDGDGNLFVCGGYFNSSPDTSSILILKVSPSGNIIWSQRYVFNPNNYGSGVNFSYDFSQSLLLGTQNYDPISNLVSTIILHYDTSGNLLKSIDFPIAADKIFLLSNGDYLLAGDVLQYNNANDSVIWMQSYGSARYSDLLVDNNSIYVAGEDSDKFVFIKYSINGNQEWAEHFNDNGFAIYGCDARYIRKDGSDNVYVSGYVSNSDHFGDGHTVTLKYREFNTFIYNIDKSEISTIAFPNPASNRISVRFESKNYSDYVVKLTDISGQTCMVNQGKTSRGTNSIALDLVHLAQGLYLLQVRVGNESEIIKVVIN